MSTHRTSLDVAADASWRMINGIICAELTDLAVAHLADSIIELNLWHRHGDTTPHAFRLSTLARRHTRQNNRTQQSRPTQCPGLHVNEIYYGDRPDGNYRLMLNTCPVKSTSTRTVRPITHQNLTYIRYGKLKEKTTEPHCTLIQHTIVSVSFIIYKVKSRCELVCLMYATMNVDASPTYW